MSNSQPVVPAVDLHETYTKELYILCTIFPAIAAISVVLRFLARRLNKAPLWWDDWTALLALIWVWVAYACVVMGIHHGKGRHIQLLSAYDKTRVAFWSYVFAVFYTATPATVKVSALLLYRRIFKSDGFNRLVTSMLILISCWGVGMVLVAIFSCTPISAFWTREGKCIREYPWALGYGIPNIIFDVMVWGMPIPRVWALNLPRNQKISLTVIFSLGLTDCVLAVIRLASVTKSLGSHDTSYDWAPAMWWCLIHTCLGIVVISIPTMRIIVVRAGKHLSSLMSSKHSVAGSTTVIRREHSKTAHETVHRLSISTSSDDDIPLHSNNSLHNNTIAMALRGESRDGSEATAVSKSGDHSHSEFADKEVDSV